MMPLNGIRFLSIVWIILGHRYFFMTTSPKMNFLEVPGLVKRLDFQLIAGAVLAVDTFFFLSGLLNAYHFMKVLERNRTFPVFKYYFHRYIRTTPSLAIMILVYATWYIKIGDGPLWNRTVAPWKQFCVENWWSTLLYINNYYNPITQCAGQSWYLAVDMQLYWVTPLIILPCWHWPKISKYYLSFLLLVSTAGQFAVAYVDKIRMSFSIAQNLEEYSRVTEEVYVPTHTRASPYIMGLMLGLFLYRLRKSNHRASVTKKMIVCGWLLSTALCLSVLLGNFPFMQAESDHPYNRLESSFYISLHRIAWGAGLSWIIFATLYGCGGPFTYFLSWNGFAPLSRLTYCIFLTHLAVQQYQFGTVRTSGYYQDFDQVHRFFGDLAMTIISSAVLCLMFESPILTIEKYINQPRRKPVEVEGLSNEGYNEGNIGKET